MIKNSLIYLLSNIFNKAIPFLMLPIIARVIDPAEFGKWTIFVVMMQFSDAVIGMNLELSVTRNYFSESKDSVAQYFGNAFFALLINVSVVFLLLTALKGVFFHQWQISYPEILCVLPYSFFETLNGFFACYLRNERKAKKYGVFQISKTFLYFLTVLFFLKFLSAGWRSMLAGSILSSAFCAIITFLILLRRRIVSLRWNTGRIREIYTLCLPMVLYSSAFIVISLSDRLFVRSYVSLYAVGIYGVANNLSVFMNLYSDAFCKAWSPWFFAKMRSETVEEINKRQVVRGFYLYLASILVIGIIGVLALKWLAPYFFPEKYLESLKYVGILVAALGFLAIHKVLQPFFVLTAKTHVISALVFVVGAINILLNFTLIPKWGIEGACYATVISYFLHTSLAFGVLSLKIIDMPWIKALRSVR